MHKAQWDIRDDKFTFTMPITKVDKTNRIVSGFATINNVDRQRDVVDAAASRKAFKEWAGNVRMMHDRIPAGKAVDIVEKQITDDSGNEYEGMWVDVYISKGAPNVWEMILDDTLKGFSIAGQVNDYMMKDQDGKSIRFITDYSLTELSLVDVPANHMATIMSIQKSADGSVAISSIYDESSESSVTIKEEETTMTLLTKIWTAVSSLTSRGGTQVDVEKALVQPDTASVVQTDKREAADQWRNADGKYIGNQGGSDLGTAGADKPAVRSVKEPDEPAVVEEPAEPTEPKPTTKVKKSLDVSDELAALTANVATVASIVETLANRIAGLEQSTDRQEITKTLDEIVGRLRAVELDTAKKQSGDIAKSTVVTPRKQSFWDGAILKNSEF